MARRKDHTRDQLKEMSIKAGRKVIKEQGFAGLSTRKIANDIGYTVGTLYNVFENFDDLMLHINFQTLEDLKRYIEKNIPSAVSGREGVRALARCYVGFAKENPMLWGAIIEHNYPPEIGLPDWYKVKTDELFHMVERYIADEISTPALVSRSAKTLWAGVHGISVLGLTGKLELVEAEPVEVLTDSLIDNYMTGLASSG